MYCTLFEGECTVHYLEDVQYMLRKGYRVITVKESTLKKLEFWKREQESWSDFLERLISAFAASLTVLNEEFKPKWAPFAELKGVKPK